MDALARHRASRREERKELETKLKAKYDPATVKARFAVKMLERLMTATTIFEGHKKDILEDDADKKAERMAECEKEFCDAIVRFKENQDIWLAARLAKAAEKLRVGLEDIDDDYYESSDDESSSDDE